MGKTHIPQNWPYVLESQLREVFFTGFNELPMTYGQVFQLLNSTQASEDDLALAGMAIWDESPDGDPVPKDEFEEIATVSYTHATFRKGFSVTKDLLEDDRYSVFEGWARELGRGANSRVETSSANVFNNAFTGGVALPDGGQLCGNARTLKNSSSTNDNYGTAKLDSADDLGAGITAHQALLDDGGQKLNINPKILLVPPTLKFAARVLVESAGYPGTGNNDINPLKSEGLQVIAWNYLTSPTAWFLIDPVIAKLKFYWRVKPEFEIDKVSGTSSSLYVGRMRYSVGASDYRGVWGSDGTT